MYMTLDALACAGKTLWAMSLEAVAQRQLFALFLLRDLPLELG